MKKEDIKWVFAYAVLFAVVMILIITEGFAWANMKFPYLAGFFQFAIFASAGEILSSRILEGEWVMNRATAFKAFCWGGGGIIVTLAFRVFSEGTECVMQIGLLPFYGNSLALAFFTSCTNNFFFAPLHSAAMRVCGSYAELRYKQSEKITVRQAIEFIDWGELVDFVLFKTIPFFWIPINTLGFLLPVEYRIVFAAMLSLVFGILMTVLKLRERRVQQ
ncbi:hypothetical protein [Sinanaerobacter sp. ZZT-01]|uniref:hypothetical protein n=1 Tax=Sinanaerobacter sp. ZZT-01 TaxID=3111540 RepID=UPI002D78E332|nr:hypothetical protein [Sinanaerobacter sp. ZZT-01]WRR93239.1 hypothetical protein U5921_14580 [Sinanaerobacter sp. ZZT-01]